jgi:hypothetical protein
VNIAVKVFQRRPFRLHQGIPERPIYIDGPHDFKIYPASLLIVLRVSITLRNLSPIGIVVHTDVVDPGVVEKAWCLNGATRTMLRTLYDNYSWPDGARPFPQGTRIALPSALGEWARKGREVQGELILSLTGRSLGDRGEGGVVCDSGCEDRAVLHDADGGSDARHRT